MLSQKLWSHCLHLSYNQFALFSPESHSIAFYPWWIVDVIMFRFYISRETVLIHLQHTTKTIHLDCWSCQSLFNNPCKLLVTLLRKLGLSLWLWSVILAVIFIFPLSSRFCLKIACFVWPTVQKYEDIQWVGVQFCLIEWLTAIISSFQHYTINYPTLWKLLMI